MNVRICFSKFGRLRFLGHLDVMRFFQRAITRAGVPIAYSAGFHPHMIMSFAQPLALSVTSDGEYFDIECGVDSVDPDNILTRLRGAMCDGLDVRSVTILPEREPNTKKQTGMSQIAGAMYLLTSDAENGAKFAEAVRKLAESSSVLVEKEGKSGVRDVDIRKGIHALAILNDGGTLEYLSNDGMFDCPPDLTGGFGRERSAHAPERPCGSVTILAAVDAGSENNISVELLTEALRKCGELPDGRFLNAHRMELFGRREDHMVSLALMR